MHTHKVTFKIYSDIHIRNNDTASCSPARLFACLLAAACAVCWSGVFAGGVCMFSLAQARSERIPQHSSTT